jgi:DNA-binding NtrC family response regulator
MTKLILVVDIETSIQELFQIALEGEGYIVIKCTPHELSLPMHEPLALALIDLNKRENTSFTILQTLQQKGVQCVVMSTYLDIIESYQQQYPTITKPFSLEAVIALVNDLLYE